MTASVIEENLWYFCCSLWNADNVSISTTGTAALEGTLALHGKDYEGKMKRFGSEKQ